MTAAKLVVVVVPVVVVQASIETETSSMHRGIARLMLCRKLREINTCPSSLFFSSYISRKRKRKEKVPRPKRKVDDGQMDWMKNVFFLSCYPGHSSEPRAHGYMKVIEVLVANCFTLSVISSARTN